MADQTGHALLKVWSKAKRMMSGLESIIDHDIGPIIIAGSADVQ